MKPKVRVRVQFGQPPKVGPVASTTPEPPGVTRVARLLALAWWLDEEIRAGRIENLAEAARELGLTRARVTQIANLILLPPVLQESIFSGENVAERALRKVIAEWPNPAQRAALPSTPRRTACTRTGEVRTSKSAK